MSHRWELFRIDQLCEVRIGRTPRRDTPEFWGGKAVWVTISELTGETIYDSKEHISDLAVQTCMPPPVPEGTLLFSFKLSIGKMGIAGSPLYTNEAIAALPIKDTKRLSSKFLRYALTAVGHEGGANNAVLGKVLNKEKVSAIKIPVPPLSDQERIVRILDEADELRRLRAQADRRTADLIPAIFHEMFGDPATNPKGWEQRRIIELAEKMSDGPFGSNLKSAHYEEKGIRVVRLQNIGIGKFLDSDKAFISKSHFNSLARHRCLPQDVLVGTMGDPNLRACLLPDYIPEALNKADCVQIRPRKEVAISEYLCWLLNMPSTLTLASGMILGQTRSRISMGRLRELFVPAPPLPLQQQFADRVAEVRALEEGQAASRKRLDDLFQSLLHHAFSGEL
jgi:type I restriction enzyme, S subunit